MPNWCYNQLEASGPAEEVKRFMKKSKPFTPWNLHPIPKELKDIRMDEQTGKRWRKLDGKDVPVSTSEEDRLLSVYGARSCNEWVNKNWGFDGRINLTKTNKTKGGVEYVFETAWTPPLPLILHFSRSFPSLSFRMSFFDPFGGYLGEICALGGKETRFKWEELEVDDPGNPYNQIHSR